MRKSQKSLAPESRAYLTGWVIYFSLTIFLMLSGGVIWKVAFPIGFLACALAITHLVFAYDQTRQDEYGVIVRLGAALRRVEAGPQMLFWPIYSLKKYPRVAQQRQFPAEPNKIFHGPDAEELPEGMSRPIRITHPSAAQVAAAQAATPPPAGTPPVSAPVIPARGQETDPLAVRMTTDVPLVATIAIVNPILFWQNIGDLENAFKRIEDLMTRKAEEILSQHTVAYCLGHLGEISSDIKQAVQELVSGLTRDGQGNLITNRAGKPVVKNNWGVDLVEAYVERLFISKEVSEQMRNVAKAVSAKQATEIAAQATLFQKQRTADGEAYQIEKEGKAKAGARQILLQKEGKGMKDQMEDMGVTDGLVMAGLQTARETMQSAQHTLITDAGLGGVAGMAATVQRALGLNPSTPASPAPATQPTTPVPRTGPAVTGAPAPAGTPAQPGAPAASGAPAPNAAGTPPAPQQNQPRPPRQRRGRQTP